MVTVFEPFFGRQVSTVRPVFLVDSAVAVALYRGCMEYTALSIYLTVCAVMNTARTGCLYATHSGGADDAVMWPYAIDTHPSPCTDTQTTYLTGRGVRILYTAVPIVLSPTHSLISHVLAIL